MKDNTNKDFWQCIAKLYAPFMNLSGKRLYKNVCQYIRPHLTPDIKLLELATGPGIIASTLADTGANIVATDFSEKMIEQSRKKSHPLNIIYEVADATALGYGAEQFDIVLIANALHIMPAPDKALSEIHRVLKPDGLLIAPTFVHAESRGYRILFRFMELIGLHTYYKWNGEQLADYITARGFRVDIQETLDHTMMPLCYLEAHKLG